MIDESNKALISDFGLAEYMGHYGFAPVNGTTPVLAPPELFDQAEHNIKFDICIYWPLLLARLFFLRENFCCNRLRLLLCLYSFLNSNIQL